MVLARWHASTIRPDLWARALRAVGEHHGLRGAHGCCLQQHWTVRSLWLRQIETATRWPHLQQSVLAPMPSRLEIDLAQRWALRRWRSNPKQSKHQPPQTTWSWPPTFVFAKWSMEPGWLPKAIQEATNKGGDQCDARLCTGNGLTEAACAYCPPVAKVLAAYVSSSTAVRSLKCALAFR